MHAQASALFHRQLKMHALQAGTAEAVSLTLGPQQGFAAASGVPPRTASAPEGTKAADAVQMQGPLLMLLPTPEHNQVG